MAIWAIADLHLSFGVPDKKMDVFGEQWVNHADKVAGFWNDSIQDEDLVLIAGDISWAKHLEDAIPDLQWIDQLPGTKMLIRGNHDYWWSSQGKMKSALPGSIQTIHNKVLQWNDWEIGGTRLWDNSEYSFDRYIEFVENPAVEATITKRAPSEEENEKIFLREMHRLKLSLDCFSGDQRIVMTHYPPIGADLQASRVSKLLEEYAVSRCIFGHLHNVSSGTLPFGEKNGVQYLLTSCDYLNFKPVLVVA